MLPQLQTHILHSTPMYEHSVIILYRRRLLPHSCSFKFVNKALIESLSGVHLSFSLSHSLFLYDQCDQIGLFLTIFPTKVAQILGYFLGYPISLSLSYYTISVTRLGYF